MQLVPLVFTDAWTAPEAVYSPQAHPLVNLLFFFIEMICMTLPEEYLSFTINDPSAKAPPIGTLLVASIEFLAVEFTRIRIKSPCARSEILELKGELGVLGKMLRLLVAIDSWYNDSSVMLVA